MAKDFVNIVKKIQRKGQPELLLSDQYAGINAKQFKKYLKTNKIKLIFTAVDCPFSNGQNERTNQTLVNLIRCKIAENRNRPWSVIADQVIGDYNNTIHSTTRFTPNYLMTGIDSSFVPPELNENKPENLEENRKIAFENSKRIHEQNKVYYDENSNPIHYKKGDMVYIKIGSHIGRKSQNQSGGSFKIKKNFRT
ncbi:hypothetical protein HHI36_013147 [Cryptolaemus montrouzieri]|uniref:Integrase catalytic domain-containing protein n=1 Tax=Cryptolaemus montrouzieri TaxID=559131 RepID=A0ABD2NHB9_9CUCU